LRPRERRPRGAPFGSLRRRQADRQGEGGKTRRTEGTGRKRPAAAAHSGGKNRAAELDAPKRSGGDTLQGKKRERGPTEDEAGPREAATERTGPGEGRQDKGNSQ